MWLANAVIDWEDRLFPLVPHPRPQPHDVDFVIRGFGRSEEPSGANGLRLIRIRLRAFDCFAPSAVNLEHRFQTILATVRQQTSPFVGSAQLAAGL